jgi:hypothetical protein
MKLRRYNQFINESVEITGDLLEILKERGKFWNEILELDYSRFDFNRSYSDVCKRINRNPEQDFQKIQKHFDEKGFPLEEIKDLFSEENNMRCGYNLEDFYKGGSFPINREPLKSIVEGLKKKLKLSWTSFSRDDYDTILQPFSVGSTLDSQGAIQDVYLYKLFEKLGLNTNIVKLGGDGWGDIDGWENGGDYSEAFIRYKYGYHQTEYGKLWMKQCQIDEDWLREESMGDLQKYIEDEFASICSKILNNIIKKNTNSFTTTDEFDRRGNIRDEFGRRGNIRALVREFKLSDFSIIEEDRIIIDINKLCLEMFKLNGQSEVKHSDIEVAAAEFTKQMEGFSLDIELTDTDDLIIWGRFKED